MSSTRFLDRPAAKGAKQARLISPEGPELRHVDELDQLLAGPDLVWVDVPSWDDEAAQVLGKLLRLHPRAMQGLRVAVFGTGTDAGPLVDSEDQFRRIGAMADSRREYLQGVIEFYQTRTTTKMTIAAERLAVIAAVTLPIAALSSVMGMNVIVNESTQISLLAVMVAMSAAPLVWARRKAGGERPTPGGLRDPVLTDGVRSAGDRMMPVSPARL